MAGRARGRVSVGTRQSLDPRLARAVWAGRAGGRAGARQTAFRPRFRYPRFAHAVARAPGIDIIGGNKFPERIAHDAHLLVFPAHRFRHRRRVLSFAEGLHRPVRLLRQAKREPLHGLGALHRVIADGRRGIRNRGAHRPAARVLLVQSLRRGEPQGDRRALRSVPAP